jgi:hypothetical protein
MHFLCFANFEHSELFSVSLAMDYIPLQIVMLKVWKLKKHSKEAVFRNCCLEDKSSGEVSRQSHLPDYSGQDVLPKH